LAGLVDDAVRMRDSLASAITEDFARAPTPRVAAKPDAAFWRGRYVARQQSMQAGIQAVRGRLRKALAGLSPAMARLAAVDEVMERVLGEQERTLLSAVPRWLEQRHNAPAGTPGPSDDAHGLDALRSAMHDTLRAELDFRWQPVEGLLDALPPGAKQAP
jgi:hypothetical protein